MSSKPLRIVICGAGVAGAIVAHLLADEPNAEVICLERASPDDHSDAGTGLNVGPNALKTLAAYAPALTERLLAVPGIGPWTAGYIAMRALRDPDAWPSGDLGLRRAMERLGISDDDIERWRPWRAYAAMHLWSVS